MAKIYKSENAKQMAARPVKKPPEKRNNARLDRKNHHDSLSQSGQQKRR